VKSNCTKIEKFSPKPTSIVEATTVLHVLYEIYNETRRSLQVKQNVDCFVPLQFDENFAQLRNFIAVSKIIYNSYKGTGCVVAQTLLYL